MSGGILLTVCCGVAWSAGTSPKLDWSTVWAYITTDSILRGVTVTVELTIIGQGIAILGGAILALMVQTDNLIASGVAKGYIWLFRGVPLLVQLLFWYNLGLLWPRLGIWIPFVDIGISANTNDLISGFTASILGLGLNEAAYMAEIIRGGILGVPRGQMDAALSIGMTRGHAMRSVVLPQTLRIIIPPTGNQFIGLLKGSALVSVIGGGDLLTSAQRIYARNFAVIPLLLVASIWYLALTTLATAAQSRIERWAAKGSRSAAEQRSVARSDER